MIFRTSMIKLLSKYILLPVFFIAIFVVAWSTSYIHVEKQHFNDGDIHQHQVKIHNHNLNSIDFPHHSSHLDTVKVEYQPHLQKMSNSKKSVVISPHTTYSSLNLLNVSIPKPFNINHKLSHLDYFKLHSRAPPQLS